MCTQIFHKQCSCLKYQFVSDLPTKWTPNSGENVKWCKREPKHTKSISLTFKRFHVFQKEQYKCYQRLIMICSITRYFSTDRCRAEKFRTFLLIPTKKQQTTKWFSALWLANVSNYRAVAADSWSWQEALGDDLLPVRKAIKSIEANRRKTRTRGIWQIVLVKVAYNATSTVRIF